MKKINITKIIIDAGVGHIRICFYDNEKKTDDNLIPSNSNLKEVFRDKGIFEIAEKSKVYITGKLADVVHSVLGNGKIILPSAAIWSATSNLFNKPENSKCDSIAVIDLSASGYLVIEVDKKGKIKDDTLIVNPRCGAGSGVNLDRVLQKLAIEREKVDEILKEYIGESGKEKREKVNVRADRCGVFSSSATISDKNQGIPLPFALAITLKSEVLKVVKKLPSKPSKVYLTGRVFAWKFARDCARDYFENKGVKNIKHDKSNFLFIKGIEKLIKKIGDDDFRQVENSLSNKDKLYEYPSFKFLKQKFESKNLYKRLPNGPISQLSSSEFIKTPVSLGLDVGSTMAKLVIANAKTKENLFISSYSNSGDTIETVKQIFRDLTEKEINSLEIQNIGITGSARYQVQKALAEIYPQIKDKIKVLVENYAHARGSIDYAKKHIEYLKNAGVKNINKDFCILVDIGGEDTKLSTISLKKAELFDNAMNVKCSAGTGSLMDTLSALFGIKDIGKACEQAFLAPKSYSINATCAVFLMENARKLQAQGYPIDEILASSNWAIIENMARTLWSQINLPKNAVALLHGQTMLSEPLPLATTNRLQEFVGADIYCLVPPYPGHRACIGLINSLFVKEVNTETIILNEFIEKEFEKKIVQCQGVACGDKKALCNRTFLSCGGDNGKKFNFLLGGCTAVNEMLGQKNFSAKPIIDSYKAIWEFIDSHNPRTDESNRLIIPRSFAVSEWAYFFSQIFEGLGIKTHIDNILEKDVIDAQPFFNIDTCAPHIGAVGQYRRLANTPHGKIFVPQIEFLPTNSDSLGRTCTINQGGVAIAKNLAEVVNPKASFKIFNVSLKKLDANVIAAKMHKDLQSIFAFYKKNPNIKDLEKVVEQAILKHENLKHEAREKAAEFAEEAIREGRQVAIVVGREYILNPGIYDSHVGRLLRDKGITVIPSYILDMDLDPQFKHLYWRNPHFIVSLVNSVAHKKLHIKLKNERLKKVFEKIEKSENLLPIVQVSTFRCGPDSVTSHFISELMKKRPFLLIQSDAIIKELAHLENRVNTYVKQLELALDGELKDNSGETFEVKILENYQNSQELDPKKDVIYFPTLSDNRSVTSAIRSSGLTCIDNYDDETYNLPDLIKEGRKVAGDSICAPLAAVYGDVIGAINDFKKRKQNNDPLVAGKTRVLVFNNKGLGPCRQGQYAEVHKLFAYQKFGEKDKKNDTILQFLVGEERKGYNFGIKEWALLRGFEGAILQGVFHQLLFDGAVACRDLKEYQQFYDEFKKLKLQIYKIQENAFKPSNKGEKLTKFFENMPTVSMFVKYFVYKFYANDIKKVLREFAKKWVKDISNNKIKIHVEGEAYMRVAQVEDIFRIFLQVLGTKRFQMTHSPIWSYVEYMVAQQIYNSKENIKRAKYELENNKNCKPEKIQKIIKENRKILLQVQVLHFGLRKILAQPLYKAAGVKIPDSMIDILQAAKQIMPTLRPHGELGPYVGEAIIKLKKDFDLFINVAPEGCMVSSMGEVLTPKILDLTRNHKGRIQNLFSQDGEVNEELLTLALLKSLGPEQYYKK